MKKQKKIRFGTTGILVVLFLAGLSLLLYPTVSNFWNSLNQTHAIGNYDKSVVELDDARYAQMLEEARQFNELLAERGNEYILPEELLEQYEHALDVSGTGIMGYVEIPSINCSLPIYHGTDEAVLQVAVGHLEWTSLPVGGEGTHSAISGHRGLPSAELLTHIDRLEVGDAFYVHVLNEVLEYRVDDIAVVLPEDTSKLQVVEGKDYMTLVTCTPYGVNSHRLLVRGERVPDTDVNSGGPLYVNNEISEVHLMYVIPVLLVIIVLVFAAVLWGREAYLARVKKQRQERRAKRQRQKGGGVCSEDGNEN